MSLRLACVFSQIGAPFDAGGLTFRGLTAGVAGVASVSADEFQKKVGHEGAPSSSK